MINPIIREDFLYYVWRTKSFDIIDLKTIDGQDVEILDWGYRNNDSGPDFSNAKVKIGETLWAGNVEMHVYTSDWEKHAHDTDPAYNNVILHIVYEHDKDILNAKDKKIPTVTLASRIDPNLHNNYADIIASESWIPCARHINKVPTHIVSFWLQRLVAERLTLKGDYMKSLHQQYNGDWESVAYIFLSKYMGAKVNGEPFEALANSLPLTILMKNKDDSNKIEALLYGQAGMLSANYKDDYFLTLKEEYNFLKKKYDLRSINPTSWKFSRMRPVGFPTIRISQLASIISNMDGIFTSITEAKDIQTLRSLFSVSAHPYWDTHYRFDKESSQKKKSLGKSFVDMVIINVVCPLLHLYGQSIDSQSYSEQAINHLESLKAESNAITKRYKELGVKCNSAADSQAIIQLKKDYCDKKKCMSCAIGNFIIQK